MPADLSALDPAELAHFLAADAKATRLRIEDTGDRLIVHPLGFPLWFVWLSLAVPASVIVAMALYRVATGRAGSLEYAFYGFAVVALPANFAFFTWFVRQINSKEMVRGPYCILDRVNRTLTLPRLGRTIEADDVLGFVQFHGWHKTIDREGFNADWMAELSVLVPDAAGGISRLPVVGSMRTDMVNHLSETLATFFDRPRQVIPS